MTKEEMKMTFTQTITREEMKNRISMALKDPVLQQGFEIICKELEQEKKLNAEIKARFVKCNTCTDEMKDKCLMFSENLCEGERCEELVDLMALVSKSDLQKENEQLKAQIENMKCCENCKHKNLNWSFTPICVTRNKEIENPLTCKCDKWEIRK